MNYSIIKQFDVRFRDEILKGDQFIGSNFKHGLYLHGAGSSSRKSLILPRTELLNRGVGTTSFDYMGHGESSGLTAKSSLSQRSAQLHAVLAARHLTGPLNVFGASMGAYDALKLTQCMNINALVLVVPAVYTTLAFNVEFGSSFSQIIRQENSWENTDAWKIIEDFTGTLIVIAAENDGVIPKKIPDKLVMCAKKAKKKELWILPGTDHLNLFSRIKENNAVLFDQIFTSMVDIIR